MRRLREVALPGLVAAMVLLYVGYMWVAGRSHTVDFAVVHGSFQFVSAQDARVPDSLRDDAPSDDLLLVNVHWKAADEIAGGAYYVVVAAPTYWLPYACEPQCDWGTTEDVTKFAHSLPRLTFPEGAIFPADEEGQVVVAFAATPGHDNAKKDFNPAAWLVQTDGTNVLGSQRINETGPIQ